MKILSISASEIYGYLNISSKFNNDLTILIGPNGSGKTTILYLMQLVLSMSFDRLAKIEFSEIELKLIDNESIPRSVVIKNGKNVLSIFVSGVTQTPVSFRYFAEEPYSYSLIQRELYRESKHSELVSFFKALTTPCFLNIERIDSAHDIDGDEQYYDPIQRRRDALISQKLRLKSVSSLIEQRFKLIADEKEVVTKELFNDIFMSLFRSDSTLKSKDPLFTTDRNIINTTNKSVLDLVAKTLSVSSVDNYKTEINEFFAKVSFLSWDSINMQDQETIIEHLEYNFQLRRIILLEDTYNKYNEQIDKITEPLWSFKNVVNEFYKDCALNIDVDSVGKVVVNRPNGVKSDIYQLSSGETQLLIIFAHLIFSAKIDNRIFIIDEPELSLHLKWQEMLSETIIKLKPSSQVILATHSPEIVGQYRNKVKILKSHEKENQKIN